MHFRKYGKIARNLLDWVSKIKETTKADQKNGEYMYLEELMRT